MRRIDIPGEGIPIYFRGTLIHRAIIIDDHLVDGKDGEDSSDAASVGCSLLPSHAAKGGLEVRC